MIGHLVPEGDRAWTLLLKLRAVMDLAFAPRLPRSATHTLDELVETHHRDYLEVSTYWSFIRQCVAFFVP